MNTYKINSLIISLAIICIAGVVAYYLHLQNDRYVIINSENGIAYELDKKSGETWVVLAVGFTYFW